LTNFDSFHRRLCLTVLQYMLTRLIIRLHHVPVTVRDKHASLRARWLDITQALADEFQTTLDNRVVHICMRKNKFHPGDQGTL